MTPITKKSGDSFVLDCRLNEPGVMVTLKQNTGARPLRERRPDGCKVTRAGQIFTVHALQPSTDQGIYACVVPGVSMSPRDLGPLIVSPGKNNDNE